MPTSGILLEQIQVQHANLGIDGSHWYHKILKLQSTQSWQAQIYNVVALKLRDSEPPQAEAHSRLYFVCSMFTNICLG